MFKSDWHLFSPVSLNSQEITLLLLQDIVTWPLILLISGVVYHFCENTFSLLARLSTNNVPKLLLNIIFIHSSSFPDILIYAESFNYQQHKQMSFFLWFAVLISLFAIGHCSLRSYASLNDGNAGAHSEIREKLSLAISL